MTDEDGTDESEEEVKGPTVEEQLAAIEQELKAMDEFCAERNDDDTPVNTNEAIETHRERQARFRSDIVEDERDTDEKSRRD